MPQTKEHLSILNLLDIPCGIIALTMTDLVDEETLELAMMEVEEVTEGSFLEGAPIILTSAASDAPQGIDELREALDNLPQTKHVVQGPFRLPVDRIFSRKGFGAVVTGTSRTGLLNDGDEVEILPEGLKARVRGIQRHGG